MLIELTPYPSGLAEDAEVRDRLQQENVLCDGRRVGYRCTRSGVLSLLLARAHRLNAREIQAVREFVRLVNLPLADFLLAAIPSVGFGAGLIKLETAADLRVAAAAWKDGGCHGEASACLHRAAEMDETKTGGMPGVVGRSD